MQVGDLIRLYDCLDDGYSIGLVCCIDEHGPNGYTGPERIEKRHWISWADGEDSWVRDDDNLEIISASR